MASQFRPNRQYPLLRALLTLRVSLLFPGCHSASDARSSGAPSSAASAASAESGGPLAALFGPVPHKTGAQLWADNCTRCHYVRQPDYYSGVQWELVTA